MRIHPGSVLTYLVSPGNGPLVAGNAVFAACFAGSVPLIGSGIGILLGITMSWGVLLLAFRRIAMPGGRDALAVSACFVLFFLTEALATANSGFAGRGYSEIAENLFFLGALPVFALMAAPPAQLFKTLATGASAGAFISLGLAMNSHLHRLELLTGNPLVLGLVASVMFGLCLCGAVWLENRWRWLCLAGALAAGIVVILTGSRTFWLTLALTPMALTAIRLRMTARAKALLAALLLLSGLGAVALYQYAPLVKDRVDAAVMDLDKAEAGEMDTSLGQRLVLWQSAVSLIREKPLLGHGGGDIARIMRERNDELNHVTFAMTHFHNAILNALVRGGVVNLAGFLVAFLAPAVLLWRNRHGPHGRPALALGASLYVPYGLSGVSGLVFGHDILDALFIGLSVILLTIARAPAAATGSVSTASGNAG